MTHIGRTQLNNLSSLSATPLYQNDTVVCALTEEPSTLPFVRQFLDYQERTRPGARRNFDSWTFLVQCRPNIVELGDQTCLSFKYWLSWCPPPRYTEVLRWRCLFPHPLPFVSSGFVQSRSSSFGSYPWSPSRKSDHRSTCQRSLHRKAKLQLTGLFKHFFRSKIYKN